MSFIKDILNISEDFSGILFEDNKIKIIKIRKENKNFFPIYWNNLDFDLDNLMEKSKMIEFFKKIKLSLKSEEINFDIISKNKKDIEKDILSNLKISGFKKINLINWNYNLNNLIINKKTIERSIFLFIENEETLLIKYVKENHIYKELKIKNKEFTTEKIKEIFSTIDHKHIFISGYFDDVINELERKFYELEIKIHIHNIWENILSFEKNIPALFKEESHYYIKSISLALPKLDDIKFIEEEKIVSKNNINTDTIEDKSIENSVNVDFIIDNKKETEIISERNTWLQIIKDIFNKTLIGPKKSKSFKYIHQDNSILNKKIEIYLPKPKKIIFLPKLNINKKYNNFNILNKVILGPKECMSFKYFYNKECILNKKIEIDKLNKYNFNFAKYNPLISIKNINIKNILNKNIISENGIYKNFKYYKDSNSILNKKIEIYKNKEKK